VANFTATNRKLVDWRDWKDFLSGAAQERFFRKIEFTAINRALLNDVAGQFFLARNDGIARDTFQNIAGTVWRYQLPITNHKETGDWQFCNFTVRCEHEGAIVADRASLLGNRIG
jgi:hypothetical protein